MLPRLVLWGSGGVAQCNVGARCRWVVGFMLSVALPSEKTSTVTIRVGAWVAPTAGLDAVEKGKNSFFSRESNPSSSTSQPVARHQTDWAIPAHTLWINHHHHFNRMCPEMRSFILLGTSSLFLFLICSYFCFPLVCNFVFDLVNVPVLFCPNNVSSSVCRCLFPGVESYVPMN
jgi:hypothetical protein